MHGVTSLLGLNAQLPLLFAQPPVTSLLLIAAIAVLVHETRRILGRSRSIARNGRENARPTAGRDGEAMRERGGGAGTASTRIEAAPAPVALAPGGVLARRDAPHARAEVRGGRRILAEAPAEASRRTHAAGIVRIALACLIVGAVAGWLAVRAARRRAAV